MVNYALRGHRVEYKTTLGDWVQYYIGTKEQCKKEFESLKERSISCRLIEVKETIVEGFTK